MKYNNSVRFSLLIISLLFFGGCSVKTAIGCSSKAGVKCANKSIQSKEDPLEPFNRAVYEFNTIIDNLYLLPAAKLYDLIVPNPIKNAFGNMLDNILSVTTIANDVLQANPKAFTKDMMRLAINSSFGVFGLYDIASDIGLKPQKEDFGQTLALWGYKQSSYLMLPILGPSTIRDAIGLVPDSYMSVPYHFSVKWRNRFYAAEAVQKRYELLDSANVLNIAGVDKYSLLRNAYLQRRNYLINNKSDKFESTSLEFSESDNNSNNANSTNMNFLGEPPE